MKFIIHRGTHEIGGSCVEVLSKNSRIVIDIGIPLKTSKEQEIIIKQYLAGKRPGQELVKDGLLPDIPGFYNWDKDSRKIDGLLISHPHIDHYGFMKDVREDICFYIGEAAKKIIEIASIFTPTKVVFNKFQHIEDEKEFSCGNFQITPYIMDHSAFDSYAFKIKADGKTIIYSGDFRAYGRKKWAFQKFLRHAPKNADAIMLEGTTLGRDDEILEDEEIVEGKISILSKKTKNIILLHCSGQNIDRLVSIYRACIRAHRKFAIDVYTANILNAIKDHASLPFPSESFGYLKVFFFPAHLKRNIPSNRFDELWMKFGKYKITREQISGDRQNIIMLVRPSMIEDLDKIKGLENAVYIHSLWKGYLKEKDEKKMKEFAREKNMEFHDEIHVSGHASVKTLKEVVNVLKPDKIIPIHTEHRERYRENFGDKVLQLSDGEIYEL